MNKEDAEKYLNKNVVIFLKRGLKWTGEILSVNENSVDVLDKFNNPATISLEDISVINQEG